MSFSRKRLFSKISVAVILVSVSSCAQDSMIRINSTSMLKLLPTNEIRYKACGETVNSCQEIFQSINNKKSELVEIARAKFDAEKLRKNQVAAADRENNLKKCRTTTIDRNTPRNYQRVSANIVIPMATQQEMASMQQCENSNSWSSVGFDKVNENNFNPTEEDTKKIIKEVSSNNLNEYTFSKSDGSIVVICPTRYCAIASGDGGWIGIGERGRSIDSTSVVK